LSSWEEIKELCADIDLIDKIDESTGTIYINVD